MKNLIFENVVFLPDPRPCLLQLVQGALCESSAQFETRKANPALAWLTPPLRKVTPYSVEDLGAKLKEEQNMRPKHALEAPGDDNPGLGLAGLPRDLFDRCTLRTVC